ncbi:hypothetical protein HNW77_06770 [Komagataeibacter sp. AV436]|uniref:Uncharacterized protein n=1 Tax=Komagataeibacter melomenusus TaxID=2766578 RepID=A0ABX2AE51_9PROT|nr:DUF5691 domain-containing protein [Komagataeibacter melomenusus]MBV1830394.1 hypothetical protein [Komagataeibacter melomenusus]NPC66096.1 hypothetical protein [Komagataeibacter melomenusus]
MVEPVYDMMAPVLARWAMGAPAAPVATAWQPVLGQDPAVAERRLLALSGQFLDTMVEAAVPASLRAFPPIPQVALPPAPEVLTPMIRRVLGQLKDERGLGLVHLLARRGYSLNPADWMPAPHDDVPALYAPWQDWAAAIAAGQETLRPTPDAPLSAENWHDFGPATRLAAFARLRHSDPAGACALFENRRRHLTADERLSLLDVLGADAGPEDVPLLRDIASTDRARKPKELATLLLARQETGTCDRAMAEELTGFFTIEPAGAAGGQQAIKAMPLKTQAQKNTRWRLLYLVPVLDFAAALDLAPTDLSRLWPWNVDERLDMDFINMAAKSGPDAMLPGLLQAILANGPPYRRDYDALAERLPVAARAQLARAPLAAEGRLAFFSALGLLAGRGELDDVVNTPAFRAVLAARTAENGLSAPNLATELLALGLLATPRAARQAMAALEQAGYLAADSRLDMLRLNIALEKTGAQE